MTSMNEISTSINAQRLLEQAKGMIERVEQAYEGRQAPAIIVKADTLKGVPTREPEGSKGMELQAGKTVVFRFRRR